MNKWKLKLKSFGKELRNHALYFVAILAFAMGKDSVATVMLLASIYMRIDAYLEYVEATQADEQAPDRIINLKTH